LSEAPILTSVVRRDRWIVAAALALACALAWAWLYWQARAMAPAMASMPAMTGMAPMSAAMAGPPPLSLAYFANAFVMWTLMMVAMMLPSAAPMILLYARFAGSVRAQGGAIAPTLLFAGVYLLAWTGFSLIAAAAQAGLAAAGAISATRLALGDGRIAGVLLLAAGAYQLTPLKRACLGQCRSPLQFVMQNWRPGWRGALTLGLRHAAYCVGCCWALMALLFVGGVMSLAWVAILALIVLAEKVAPLGKWGARTIGALAGALGVAMIAGLPFPLR
jgi:predicted metal-binding membrane protein